MSIANWRKPFIGVIPLVDETKDSYWMLPGYFKGIEEAGGIPVMFPLTDDEEILARLMDAVDGLLMTGGHDVDPSIYGEKPTRECGISCPERDAMERLCYEMAKEMDMPVFGICRGIQLINALEGGTLYQDLPTEHPSKTEHHQSGAYEEPIHKVMLVKGSPLHELLGKDELAVNSYHHQAIKKVSPVLSVMAESEDGLVEAVCHPSRSFIWAVQWHPEFSYKVNEDSRKLLKLFVDKAEKYHH